MSEQYNEDSIKSLEWNDHIRLRPGMYIGKLGDGVSSDDGIYVLVKEVIDNSIDEFVMGNGKRVDISIEGKEVTVRDYGRGIPLGKLVECVSKINTGAKYDSKVFKKSVGLNGVGTKAVNALSSKFIAQSFREGKSKVVHYEYGNLIEEKEVNTPDEKNGTLIKFIPDESLFVNYRYRFEHVEKLLWNYAFLNRGLSLYFNNQRIFSKNGLLDLLDQKIDNGILYPIIHIEEGDLEFTFTHAAKQYGE